MPAYSTRKLALTIGGHVWQLRVLCDLQQFSDPDGHGERLGISAAAPWRLLGQVRRILEPCCGIGLASLVLRRGAESRCQ